MTHFHRPLCLLLGLGLFVSCGLRLARADQPATPNAPDPRTLLVAPASFPWASADTATLRASGPRVLAHYMGTHTMQRYIPDGLGLNYHATVYQDVFGEDGQHSAYGGLERTGPLWDTSRYPVPYAALEAAQLADCEDEIREMIAAGIDGIVLNIQGGPGAGPADQWAVNHWVVSLRIVQAALNVDPGFVVLVSPDMHTWFGEHPEDWLAVARWAATLPNAYRLPDGRLVLGTYEPWADDAPWWTETWWSDTLATLAGEGLSIAWWPTFNGCHNGNGRPGGISPVGKWQHLAHGFMEWGDRAAASAYAGNTASGHAVQSAGRAFAAPVGNDYLRTFDATLPEVEASLGLREAWRAARDLHAEIVQICTWNDYHEHAAIAPTGAGQWNWLQHHAWEIHRAKLGAEPQIVEDRLVLFHRSQLVAAPVSAQTLTVDPAGKVDIVELVAYLARPATLELVQGPRVDTLAGVAGRNLLRAPAQPGAMPVARLHRADGESLTLASRVTVRAAVDYQDLVYRGTDSTDLARTTRSAATYAAWRGAHFSGAALEDEAVSGPLADPYHCGLANLQRYAHELPAHGVLASPVTSGILDTPTGRVLTLRFPRRASAAGLSYVVEASTDLVGWNALPGRTYAAGLDPITAEDLVPLGAPEAPRRFIRLKVVQEPVAAP